MTPERRKELEERAREWLADHVMHVKVTGYDSILSLLEAVDREAEERGRREEREHLAGFEKLVWMANPGTVDSCRFCAVWRDEEAHRPKCPAHYMGTAKGEPR